MKPKSFKKKELGVLACCVGLSCIVHGIFVVSGFAEPDAARLAVLAAEWYHTGTFSSYSYVLQTSPLYLHTLKSFMGMGVPLNAIPVLMNWGNVILGSFTLIPLYFLWCNLANRQIAAIACLLFFFTPTFWLANIYGMPHLPSFSFFVISLIVFALASRRAGKNAIIFLTTSTALAVVSVGFKADIILCFGAFFGVAFYLGDLSRRNVALSVLIPVTALIVVVLYTKLITPPILSLGDSANQWAHQFPFTIRALLHREHSLILANSAGKVLFFVTVLSVAYCIMWRSHLRALVLVLLWALPPILFWGLKWGNSARHLMASYSVLMFLVAIVITALIKKRWLQWLSVALLLVANYWISPLEGEKRSPTSLPTSRLHGLMASVHAYADYRHELSSVFADIGVDQKLYVGSTTIPYVVWEALAKAQSVEVAQLTPKVYRLRQNDNPVGLLRIDEVKRVRGAMVIGPENDWLVFSFEAGVITKNVSRFKKYDKELKEAVRMSQQQIND